MKNLKAILIFLTFLSCSTNDDEPKVTTANVTYSQTSLDAEFYKTGSSAAPNIDWNGNQGSFSLDKNIEGLSINSSTGQVNWTKLLPPGKHEFNVVVVNSAGQISVPITIENPFSGYFQGTYSGSTYFAFEFFEGGTVNVEANSETNPNTASGTWEITGNELIANYEYDERGDKYSIKGTLSQTNLEASISGNWYNESDAISGNERREFEIQLQED